MYRDFSELSMMSKTDWSNEELAHFRESFQQLLPYLNAEGGVIYKEILKEMEARSSSSH